jgi:hypothetical protein
MRKTIIIVLLFVGALAAGFLAGQRQVEKRTLSQETEVVATESAPATNETETVAEPFRWSQIATTNNQEFVYNLRTIRCPEPTITEILRGTLQRAYGPRFVQIAKEGSFAGPTRASATAKRREALNAEIESVMYNELKLKRVSRSANTLFTAEQEELITDAVARFPRVNADGANWQVANSNLLARLEILTPYLTEEQMQYYKLDREGGAPQVDKLLRGMQPTKEEFLIVARAIEGQDTSLTNGMINPALMATIQGVLAPDRFALLQNLQLPEYRTILAYAQARRWPNETVNTLLQLRKTIYPIDPTTYQAKVIALLPQEGPGYLQNKTIHPAAAL